MVILDQVELCKEKDCKDCFWFMHLFNDFSEVFVHFLLLATVFFAGLMWQKRGADDVWKRIVGKQLELPLNTSASKTRSFAKD